ncbi:LysR substrate-binding domain-containing protein [Neisseriaceae bacterium B1]
MKLQQLRYAVEVFRHNLNVSEAAEALFTSQPGVSKQIRLLEEELGTQIFIRSGKRIVAVTQPGQAILETASQVLREVQNIKNISGEFTDSQSGVLTIAATHTQMRYRLPETVAHFLRTYPEVRLNLKQGTPEEIAQMVFNGEADLAFGEDVDDNMSDLRRLPCGQWHYALIVPREHALLQHAHLSLADIAAYPLLSNEFAFQAASAALRAFNRARLSHYRVAFQAADNEVLKTYVRLGLGVALIDAIAFDETCDTDLVAIDVGHLFDNAFYHAILRSDTLIRSYTYDFIEHLCPSLNKDRVNQLLYAPSIEDFSI